MYTLGSRGATPPPNRKSPTSDQGTQAEPIGVPDTSKPPPNQPLQQHQQHHQHNDNRRRPSGPQQQQQQIRDRGWEKRDVQHDYRPANNSANYARGRGNNRGERGCKLWEWITQIKHL